MKLWIDGNEVVASAGQSLLDLINNLGLDRNELPERPIAAKIAGQVFNLNYIPVRQQDLQEERVTLRRAMSASAGQIHLLRYADPAGKDVYQRTVQFLLFLALRQLWPNARAKMNCTIGPALYIEVGNEPAFDAERLKRHFRELVQEDFPLIRRRISTADAIAQYTQDGQDDKARCHGGGHRVHESSAGEENAHHCHHPLCPVHRLRSGRLQALHRRQ